MACFILQLKNESYYDKLINILLNDVKFSEMFLSFFNIGNKIEIIPMDQSKCNIMSKRSNVDFFTGTYKILHTGIIMENINSVIKMCSKITFYNIGVWCICENIHIKNDIIIETNKNTLVKINNNKHIKIKY